MLIGVPTNSTVCPRAVWNRIVAQWHDQAAGKVYVFESDPIGFDPSEFLRGTVPVYVDPADPRRYLVDTSVLPAPGNLPDPEESE